MLTCALYIVWSTQIPNVHEPSTSTGCLLVEHGVWLLDCVDRGQRPVSVSGGPWTETEAREPSKENTPATNSSRRSKSSDQTKLRERKRIGSRPTGDRNRYGGLMQQHCPEWPCQCCHHARREPATARRADPGSSYFTQSKHVLGGTSGDSLLVGQTASSANSIINRGVRFFHGRLAC